MLTCIWHRNNRFEPRGAVQVAQISGNGDEVHGGVPPLGSQIEADAVIVGRGEGAHSQQVRPDDDQQGQQCRCPGGEVGEPVLNLDHDRRGFGAPDQRGQRHIDRPGEVGEAVADELTRVGQPRPVVGRVHHHLPRARTIR